MTPTPTVNTFWHDHSGKMLAGLLTAATISVSGWALQMDRSSQKIQFQLAAIAEQLDEKNFKLNMVYDLDKRVTRIEDANKICDERFKYLESKITSVERRERADSK